MIVIDPAAVLLAELEHARARIAELKREAGAARRERAEIVAILKTRTKSAQPGGRNFARQLLKTMEEADD